MGKHLAGPYLVFLYEDESLLVRAQWPVSTALAVLVWLSIPVSAQRFRHVETQRNFPRADFVLEVADLNDDGRDDIVVGGRQYYPDDGRAEHRFRKSVVRLLFGTRSGRCRPAPGRFVQGTVRARWPNRGRSGLQRRRAAGSRGLRPGSVRARTERGGRQPPQLYLSRGRRLYRSPALATAVRREHRENPDHGRGTGGRRRARA